MSDQRGQLGLTGEKLAEQYLRKQGMKTLARRYTAPVGELDLVMRADQTIVFVEVKTQRDRIFKDPQEQVGPTKLRRMTKTARWFLHAKRLEDHPCRFDVVAVVLPETGDAEIEHFPEAFIPIE